MDSTGIWGAVAALVTGVTSKSAYDYLSRKKASDEKKDNDIIEAKDEFIKDLQRRYLRLEDRLTELHNEFIESEKNSSSLQGRIVELEHRVEELEGEVKDLEIENRVLKAQNDAFKTK